MSVDFSTVNNYWNLSTGEFQIKGKNDPSYALRVYEDGKIYINGDIIADDSLTISNLGSGTDIVYGNVENGNITKIVGDAIKTQKLEYDDYNYWNLATGDFIISSKTRRAIYNDSNGLHIDADNITVGTLRSNFIADGITFDKFNGLSVANGKWKIDFTGKQSGKITIGDINANNITSGKVTITDDINVDELIASDAFIREINSKSLGAVTVDVKNEFSASNIIAGSLILNNYECGWKVVGTGDDYNPEDTGGDVYVEPGTTVGDDSDIEIPDYFDPEVREIQIESYDVPEQEKGGVVIYNANKTEVIGKWDVNGIYATKGYFRSGDSQTGSMFKTTTDKYGSCLRFDNTINLIYSDKQGTLEDLLVQTTDSNGGFRVGLVNKDTFLLGGTYLGYFDNSIKETDNYGIQENDGIIVNCKATGSGTSRKLEYDDLGAPYSGITDDIEIEFDEDGNVITETQLHFVNGILVHVGDL